MKPSEFYKQFGVTIAEIEKTIGTSRVQLSRWVERYPKRCEMLARGVYAAKYPVTIVNSSKAKIVTGIENNRVMIKDL